MTLQQIQTKMIDCMKSGDKIGKAVYSDIIATAKNLAIKAKSRDNISEEIVTEAILKAKKTCQEQIDTCPAERADLMQLYTQNMSYIEQVAPHMMTEDEVKAFIKTFLFATNYKPNSQGDLMKYVMPKLKGKADGKLVKKVVEATYEEVSK